MVAARSQQGVQGEDPHSTGEHQGRLGRQVRRFEKVVSCSGKKDDDWKTYTSTFNPTKMRPDVTEMKVMLFAYHPAGVYWFDNVSIEEIAETPQKSSQ